MAGMDRVTVPEAAERLGLSENAVRKRVQRSTIRWDRDEDGRVYVYLSEAMTDQADGIAGDQAADQSPVIERMASEIDFLRRELERKDALLLNMTEVMKAINPPPEPRESPVTPSQEQGDGDVPPEKEKRSWWRRLFGN